jgi:hypothetical protein
VVHPLLLLVVTKQKLGFNAGNKKKTQQVLYYNLKSLSPSRKIIIKSVNIAVVADVVDWVRILTLLLLPLLLVAVSAVSSFSSPSSTAVTTSVTVSPLVVSAAAAGGR